MLPSPSSPILFSFGPIEVRWYGLIIVTGIILAYVICRKLAPKRGVPESFIDDFLLWGVIGGILGARLYYVLFQWEYYKENLGDILAVWEGGLAIHGAIIGAGLVAILFCRKMKVSFWKFADLGGLGLILGQAFGRWGNYFNQEAFGAPTDFPWGIYISPENRPTIFAQSESFHPTFFYESMWNFAIFLILISMIKRGKAPSGAAFCVYLVLYSLGRFFIEALRTDSLMLGDLRIAQIISVVLVVGGLVLLKLRYKATRI